uniref:Uncharacterized protein n=1 Tax=Ditylenchus dipsaci TaxID=166011 RepID=A0A915DX90_9BILA
MDVFACKELPWFELFKHSVFGLFYKYNVTIRVCITVRAAHRRLHDALGVDHPTVGRPLQDLNEFSALTTCTISSIWQEEWLQRRDVSTTR